MASDTELLRGLRELYKYSRRSGEDPAVRIRHELRVNTTAEQRLRLFARISIDESTKKVVEDFTKERLV